MYMTQSAYSNRLKGSQLREPIQKGVISALHNESYEPYTLSHTNPHNESYEPYTMEVN